MNNTPPPESRPPILATIATSTPIAVRVFVGLEADFQTLEEKLNAVPTPSLFSNLTSFFFSSALTLWITAWSLAVTPAVSAVVFIWAASAATVTGVACITLDIRRQRGHIQTRQDISRAIENMKANCLEQSFKVALSNEHQD